MKTLRTLILTLVALVCVHGTPSAHAAESIDQAKLRKLHAAFLVNFMKFTEWPARDNHPLKVVFVDRPALANTMTQAVSGRSVQGRGVTVENRGPLPDVRAADDVWARYLQTLSGDVIYAPADRRDALTRLTRAAAGQPVLIVADRPEGILAGSMLAFDLKAGRVVFHGSRRAIDASTLTLKAPAAQARPNARLAARPATRTTPRQAFRPSTRTATSMATRPTG